MFFCRSFDPEGRFSPRQSGLAGTPDTGWIRMGLATGRRVGRRVHGLFLLWICMEYMEVSTNGGTPKWMVYNRKSIKMDDDLGVPPFMETTIWG